MKIGIVGGSGYAGGELLRILADHPVFSVEAISAHSNAGEPITSVHPQLASYKGKSFSAFSPELFTSCELVFLALPHGESASAVTPDNFNRHQITSIDFSNTSYNFIIIPYSHFGDLLNHFNKFFYPAPNNALFIFALK